MASRRKHQLSLRGIVCRHCGAPLVGAKRDWSAREFARALARNGLRVVLGAALIEDAATGERFQAVTAKDPIRIRRRATVAKILRTRHRRAVDERKRLAALFRAGVNNAQEVVHG